MLKVKVGSLKGVDIWLILLMTMLTALGVLAISSATLYSGSTGVVQDQIKFFLMGLILMGIVTLIDYHLLGEWYIGIYIMTLIVLAAVLVFGQERNGAARWISIGGFGLQPSEFAKIAMILCTAKLISKQGEKINHIGRLFLILGFQLIPFILINRQPNLSTSIVILALLILQLFTSKLSFKYIFGAVSIGILLLGIGITYIVQNPNQKLLPEYQRARIITSLQGQDDVLGSHYQTNKSVHAIGSGGLKGKGLYNGSISQLNYLPESHNDFIVAVIAEEFGFVGISALIGILLLIILRGFWIAFQAPDEFGRLIVVGYIGMIAIQAFVNMGVVTNLLPNTGLPLPFISYGGSSLWANMMGMGLVLNVGMRKENTMF
jgi:rod shape determining protein RodA